MAELRIGTSAFRAEGWEGTFYPKGIAAREQLSYYATQFDTVELDNTFYRTPAISTVRGWYAKTPPGFTFAAKVPQVITHEKVLVEIGDRRDVHPSKREREKRKAKRDFIAQNACDGAEVLTAQADRFAGANREEKAPACSVRNDRRGYAPA
jgi:uncharacterized protein YecE (DUF72 family)